MRFARSLTLFAWTFGASLGFLGMVAGCGQSKEGTMVKVDAAKDEDQQKKMIEYMQSKKGGQPGSPKR